MPKPRKMLSDMDAPYIRSLMRAIETQSTATIATWCIDYAEAHILPLWTEAFPDDPRPEGALKAAREYLAGEMKLADAKKRIMECRAAARETEGSLVPQGAARTVDSAASAIHNPTGSIGLALYGAVTVVYSREGTALPWDMVESLASEECAKMEAALLTISVENEPNPAKIKWNC